jgi:hypothetical protein
MGSQFLTRIFFITGINKRSRKHHTNIDKIFSQLITYLLNEPISQS